MLLLLQYTLIFASVLLLVALGGCFSEHSGVINIGLEGIMVMGALGGALMMKFLPAGTSAFVVVLLTVLASILLGMIYSLLLAVAAVNFKADQTLVGTAMNLLGTAAATVFVKAMNTAADPDNVSSTIQYLDGRKAFLVNIGGFEFNWCMLLAVIALVIAYVVLYKTRFGLRLCACGEHPQAADSVGINVYRMRYAGVLISGVLGGLGGIVYIIAGVSEWKFENGVAGFGFLALAVMIFGQWKPTRIALAALLFGFFRALGNVYSGFDLLSNLNLPSSVYNMLPYVISLVVLAFTSQKSRAPKAEGIPYDKGQRSFHHKTEFHDKICLPVIGFDNREAVFIPARSPPAKRPAAGRRHSAPPCPGSSSAAAGRCPPAPPASDTGPRGRPSPLLPPPEESRRHQLSAGASGRRAPAPPPGPPPGGRPRR